MIANIGLLAALGLLIVLALRGVNIIFASLLGALLIVVTNQLPLAASFSDYYAFGPLGAFSFAGKFFILFVCGSIFGRVMGESYAAASLANALSLKLGAHRALWIITLACAVLTYGGVIIFIVVFTLYPLSLQLLQTANIPKRLFCGALALGGGTFTLTAMPGTPSVQNVIAASALGTDLFAGAWLGIIASLIMFGIGIWYLERERLRAQQTGEGFVPGPKDNMPDHDPGDDVYPPWGWALLPMVLVLSTILLPRLLKGQFAASPEVPVTVLEQLMAFANSQPILWPSIALVIGSVSTVFMFARLRSEPLVALGRGAEDAIMPLMNTAAVIGFGGVVVHTSGFQLFTGLMLDSGLPPLASLFISTSAVSALVGSSSGGLQIFMETMAPSYLALGMEPGTLHRLSAIISGGFDSLPHCGAIVALLTITGQTHKQAYRVVGTVTVLIPVVASLALLAIVAVSG
ncbi:MAG: GntP family permease [Halieaceae bacterium]